MNSIYCRIKIRILTLDYRHRFNMADLIPIFPLQLVLFPNEKLNLHIFEPRYKQLIKDVKDSQIEFGIPFFQKGKEMRHGTTAKLLDVSKTYGDGTMDIKSQGLRMFRIHEVHSRYEDKLYSAATVDFPNSEQDFNKSTAQRLRKMVLQLYEIMKIDKAMPGINTVNLSFEVGHHLGMSKEQELELLMIHSEEGRQEYLINHLDSLIPIVIEMEELRKKVEMNGHFKNVIPPQF